MKKILLIILLIPIFSFSQRKEVLKYFKSKDSLVGVKNQDGKIIVPAQFKVFSYLKDGELVEGETIYFDGFKKDEIKEKNAWGYVYDKKGNFLYRPFFYDNGADYFSEGVRRFVKNGKVGFVDRNGTIVIEANHDFAAPFNYGYSAFCNGCDWEKTNEEHKAIVGGNWGMMNFKGEIVQPITKSENAVEIDGKYYPYPFKYSEKEKNILQFFEKQNKKLSEINYVNHYNKIPENEKKLFFEIVERPKENFPFYQINAYDYRKMEAGLSDYKFLASEDGKNIFALEFESEKIPFEKWLKKEIKEAEEFQKEHPDNPNKLSK
ncbi:WG containing repeat-containing protein [Chryseobacterium soldanellicola]|uniref:WG containing repeat-containing protein n=1 Tax=Chryseobacterium soldanellicola TaxID=311333 RepID=A0A1H1FL01_9FLAO|nr:WG repeat-containing protein [Chryseobacterium soldanellicola]SDR01712.1 WG containing repeat-containing protein [Chryseobacterium soldanellicola]